MTLSDMHAVRKECLQVAEIPGVSKDFRELLIKCSEVCTDAINMQTFLEHRSRD